jgi:hypothetical protein
VEECFPEGDLVNDLRDTKQGVIVALSHLTAECHSWKSRYEATQSRNRELADFNARLHTSMQSSLHALARRFDEFDVHLASTTQRMWATAAPTGPPPYHVGPHAANPAIAWDATCDYGLCSIPTNASFWNVGCYQHAPRF